MAQKEIPEQGLMLPIFFVIIDQSMPQKYF
jgi:hypothetical protein